MRIAIVVSDYNSEMTSRLLASAQKTLAGISDVSVSAVVHVPGCFEIPMAAQMLAQRHPAPDAIVCLGVILQGTTDQNTHIVRSVAVALQSVQMETGVPASYGIISAPNEATAWDRTHGDMDRGREAALAAVAMARLKNELGSPGTRKRQITPFMQGVLPPSSS